jgi:hypothetical protein
MYQLPDDDGRLAEFANCEDPSALQSELALARYVAEKSAQQGQHGLTLAGLSVIAKLSTAHQAAMIRGSRHLSKDAVMAFGRATAALLIEIVNDLPRLTEEEKTAFVDTFLNRFADAIASASNAEKKRAAPLLLEHDKP